MAFQVDVKFGGLCAHVPNKPLDQKPTRMWVVMPEARAPWKRTICKHFPAIVVDADRVAGAGGQTKLYWPITRKEITLHPEWAAPTDEVDLDLTSPSEDQDFRRVPDLGVIKPAAATINPAFRKDKESKGLVVARVILDKGYLRSLPVSSNLEIYFPNGDAFGTATDKAQFAHDALLSLPNLKKLVIEARDLDTGTVDKLPIFGGTDLCEITIGNLCSDLWLSELGKLQPYPDLPGPGGALTDPDFEAFYTLSNPEPKSDPKGPVPTWPGGGGSTGGSKCHMVRFNPFDEAA